MSVLTMEKLLLAINAIFGGNLLPNWKILLDIYYIRHNMVKTTGISAYLTQQALVRGE